MSTRDLQLEIEDQRALRRSLAEANGRYAERIIAAEDEVRRLRAALRSLIRAGSNGSADFDAEARRIEREVLGRSKDG